MQPNSPDPHAPLHPLVYQRLRQMASRQLAREPALQTLNTTALVHEAWLDLAARTPEFADQAHFFAYAATAMRHILVDHARQRLARKRGGSAVRLDLDTEQIPATQAAAEILQLHEALERLDRLEPRLARVVELRFFAGLSTDETAQLLGIVNRTVVRDWARAKAFLRQACG